MNYLYQINDSLWEGSFFPRLPNGKRKKFNVYAETREQCEAKLADRDSLYILLFSEKLHKSGSDHFFRSQSTAVFLFHTFSLTISPSLRIGYMMLPKHLVKTHEEKRGFYSCTVPTFMQYVLTELIDNGDFERHINRVRRGLRKQNK